MADPIPAAPPKTPEAPAKEAAPLPKTPTYADLATAAPLPSSEPAAASHGRERVFVAGSLIFGVALCACMVAWLSRKQDASVRQLMRKVETLQKQVQTPAQTTTSSAAPGQPQTVELAALGSPAEALRRGAQLFDEGRFADAIPYFDAASRNATTPAAAYYLGLSCLRVRDSLRATRLLRSIVTNSPSSPYAVRSLYWLGREALDSGNPDAALRLFSSVMSQEDALTAEDGEILAGVLYGMGEAYAMTSDRAESEEQAASGRPPAATPRNDPSLGRPADSAARAAAAAAGSSPAAPSGASSKEAKP